MRRVSVLAIMGLTVLLISCAPQSSDDTVDTTNSSSNDSIETVATDLRVPWGIAFLPSGDLLVTERPGTLRRIGERNRTYEIPQAMEYGEGGLMGIELHPNFTENRKLYLYHTYETGGRVRNKIVQYRLNGSLHQRNVLLEGIPGAPYHDGGRLEFGPDGKLYATVGDATEAEKAQDPSTLHGTVLRLNPDGAIPDGNPFDSVVYSYGHRNAQGLAWHDGDLWITEHGRSGFRSGLDELNLVRPGRNYGWPVIEGDEAKEGMEGPVVHSGPDVTWAPGSAAVVNDSLYFGGLRGKSLYEAHIANETITELEAHFKGRFGRLRAVHVGPEGDLYVTTSNRDGRGDPRAADDKILRVDPSDLS